MFNQASIGIITQARMTSSRLPGKIFKEIKNKTLLQYHIERLQKTGLNVIIATTTNTTDDIVSEYAQKNNISFYRGNEQNVLSRFYEAALKYNLEVIIRVTSDCPLIDQHLIRNGVEKYIQMNNPNLYVSNCFPRTYARGFDFEIFSFQALKEAYENATEIADKEHVTSYIHQNKSGKTEFYNINQTNNNSHLRITVDTPEDFELIKQLIEKYNAENLSYNEIETLLNQHPELTSINKHIEQKKF